MEEEGTPERALPNSDRRIMSTIEMTDVDGDALSVISRGDSTWITCTSGSDEVTVGPFPTHLVRSILGRGLALEDSTVAALVKRGPDRAGSCPPGAGDVADEAPAPPRAHGPAAEALDGEPEDAAGTPSSHPSAATALSEELRRAEFPLEDVDLLAAHLVSLGYRRP